jgi:hypothetical protein
MTNPFAHEGKRYFVVARFNKMLTPDTAHFGDGIITSLVLFGVPKSAFEKSQQMLIVGVVAPFKGPGSNTLRMRYVHELCGDHAATLPSWQEIARAGGWPGFSRTLRPGMITTRSFARWCTSRSLRPNPALPNLYRVCLVQRKVVG